MGTTFKAVQKLKYLQLKPLFILHSRVVELHPEETERVRAYNEQLNSDQRKGFLRKETLSEFREYKCLVCGAEWREEIHSPIIVDDITIKTYYSDAEKCITCLK